MTRAEYVHYEKRQLIVVYDSQIRLDRAKGVWDAASQLAKLPGVQAEVARDHIGNSKAQPTTIIRVSFEAGANARTAVAQLKELTQPKLPYTLVGLR